MMVQLIPQLSNMENFQVTNSAAADGIADGEVLSISTAGLTGITKVSNIAGVQKLTTFNVPNSSSRDVEIKSAPKVYNC